MMIYGWLTRADLISSKLVRKWVGRKDRGGNWELGIETTPPFGHPSKGGDYDGVVKKYPHGRNRGIFILNHGNTRNPLG